MRRPSAASVFTFLFVVGLAACSADTLVTGLPDGASPTTPASRISTPPRYTPRYVAITAGDDFTCVLTKTSTVYCWGRGDSSQVGSNGASNCSGSVRCTTKPTIVRIGADTLFASSISAGTNHACAIDLQNNAWCWGAAGNGQVGLNFGSGPSGPIQVPGTSGITFHQISSGFGRSCAQANTGIICWGQMRSIDTLVAPHWLTANAAYTAVSVGQNQICALQVQGTVDCGGVNQSGQAALDSVAHPFSGPFPTSSLFGSAVNGVSAGGLFTCADEANDTVRCSGDDFFGELGNGRATLHNSTPQLVGSGMALHAVTSGNEHACALDNSHSAWCWGNSNTGQIGNDPTNSITGIYSTPQHVYGRHPFVAIAAGSRHTCAIANDALAGFSQIWCWGNNDLGQLGLGYTGSWWASPVQAIDPP